MIIKILSILIYGGINLLTVDYYPLLTMICNI